MSLITYADGTPTQQRNAIRRSIAEILRRLMEKKAIDNETKDMLAFIVVGLRSIGSVHRSIGDGVGKARLLHQG